jgi:hypothetical protein
MSYLAREALPDYLRALRAAMKEWGMYVPHLDQNFNSSLLTLGNDELILGNDDDYSFVFRALMNNSATDDDHHVLVVSNSRALPTKTVELMKTGISISSPIPKKQFYGKKKTEFTIGYKENNRWYSRNVKFSVLDEHSSPYIWQPDDPEWYVHYVGILGAVSTTHKHNQQNNCASPI